MFLWSDELYHTKAKFYYIYDYMYSFIKKTGHLAMEVYELPGKIIFVTF